MQDNAPCHKAKKIIKFLKVKNIETMDWPPQSPDLNPIENLWKTLGERVRQKNPANTEKLWQFLKTEWEKITIDECRSLIDSCIKRCMSVIQSKGLATKY